MKQKARRGFLVQQNRDKLTKRDEINSLNGQFGEMFNKEEKSLRGRDN